MTGRTQNATVSARRHITSRPGISLLHRAGGEDPLLLDQHRAGLIAPLFVGPDTRGDVVDRVDDVLWPVVADHAVHSLGGVAADRHGRVDEKI